MRHRPTIIQLFDETPPAPQPHGWPERLVNALGHPYQLVENEIPLSGSHEATYAKLSQSGKQLGKRIVARLHDGSYVISSLNGGKA